MTGAVRDFVPLRDGHASIYLCGATVQGLPHIGHVRSGVAFDVLRRWLTAKGYDVAFIRNVTDIDDKILNKAADAGRPWWEWAATFERAFTAAYDALGVLPPSAEPRATGHITQMVELIQRLIDDGHAYAGGGDVYFDVLSYPEYGTAVRATASTTCTRARVWRPASATARLHAVEGRQARRAVVADAVGPGPPRLAHRMRGDVRVVSGRGVRHPRRRHGPGLPAPRERDRPGQGAAGDGFAQYWLHNGWVTMGGEKMSKSLGNVLSIPAVLQRVRAAELRYYLGSAHYRSMLEFSETALHDAVKAYTGIEDFLHRVRSRVGTVVPGDVDGRSSAPHSTTTSACPLALAEVHAARAEGNRALDAGDHDAAMAHAQSIRAMMGILGCDPLDERWESRDETIGGARRPSTCWSSGRSTQRQEAREQRDWAQADEIRDRLKAAGIEVTDTADGPQWSLLRGERRSNGRQLTAPRRRAQGQAPRRARSGRVRAASADAGWKARARRRPPTSDRTIRRASAPPRRPSSSAAGRPARPTTSRSCSAATPSWSACAPVCPPPRCTSRSGPRPTSG